MAKKNIPFSHKLVLNQWLFGLFGLTSTAGTVVYNGAKMASLEAFKLKFQINELTAEGVDTDNRHFYFKALTNRTDDLPDLPHDVLRVFDENIVRHTLKINERRLTRGKEAIVWKYFQYLTLLFTEIYFNWYFNRPVELRVSLNEQINAYNLTVGKQDQLDLLNEGTDAWSELNKVAFWSATGSGKTLLMHVNLLQYQHYLGLLPKNDKRSQLNRIILLTPNEGLSKQHLEEFNESGIDAELFSKNGRGLFSSNAVEIIDIHKLKEDSKEKTVAVDAFESNNLVLVDEGHSGAGRGVDGVWMDYRNRLCAEGFSFEYSATFGQAIKGEDMTQLYARSILFDYSYRYFYRDGFGKDYQILNLNEETESEYISPYLIGCLLSFYQQLHLYKAQTREVSDFNLEKPLWIFVGSTVTKSLSTREASDVIEILLFLARYVANRHDSIQTIENVLKHGLVAANGKNLFADKFQHLDEANLSAQEIFDDTLRILFNAPGGGRLHIEKLKSDNSEIALRVGTNKPFGLINIGDAGSFANLCEDRSEFVVNEPEFSKSLFSEINGHDSPINVLIGSKKFTEGWSSWRVSTMGLMNMGRSKGAQIIQLFGRGVRLKGFSNSLKRSSRVSLPDGTERPKHLRLLETLNIFGIKANYMAEFRKILEDEGLPTNDERAEYIIPVKISLPGSDLKTVKLKESINGVTTQFGNAFKRLAPVPRLKRPDPATEPSTQYLVNNKVVLNLLPKIDSVESVNTDGGEGHSFERTLDSVHVAFLDIDRIYFELERFKAERGWFNLNITHEAIRELLEDTAWYRIQIMDSELVADSFSKVRRWEEIAIMLLKKYTERYYLFRKREWEEPHLEYQTLDSTDRNFLVKEPASKSGYRFILDDSKATLSAKVEELKRQVESGGPSTWTFKGTEAIWFGEHLYQPLMCGKNQEIEISPVPLNEGETVFVKDLEKFIAAKPKQMQGVKLYLLRNLSRGTGVGFFEAGNFHPDFIMWLVMGKVQTIVFIDPKGIRNLGIKDPKIQFHKTVKEVQQRLGDPNVRLESFIISNTLADEMKLQWNADKPEMEANHILFQKDDKDTYLRKMFEMIASLR